MQSTFFFYDLETTGVNPRTDRIMQFAGQRTTIDLEPVGEPVNILIQLSSDVVPEPDAILITGITPQQTLQEGVKEAEFAKLFTETIAIPGTIFAGFNSIRFDDEFMRFLLYRNFQDPYEWQWQDNRSKWDLLDVVRMTRALRPDGITWPFDSKGTPTNRLELLTDLNALGHEKAHDALSDVYATIAVAKLLKERQSKLFDYLLGMRNKKSVQELVSGDQPFVYSSGKYPSDYQKTTVAVRLTDHPKKQGVLVYDLRHDPTKFLRMSIEEIASAWQYDRAKKSIELPVKTLQYNRCPAVAPIGVLDAASRERIHIDLDQVKQHLSTLRKHPDFNDKIISALQILESQQQTAFLSDTTTADTQLYDSFIPDQDKLVEQQLLQGDPSDISLFAGKFRDSRLNALVPLYKSRNYPHLLNDEERLVWEKHRHSVLLSGGDHSAMARFFARLGELAERPGLTGSDRYLLEELQIYGQSIMPVPDEYAG